MRTSQIIVGLAIAAAGLGVGAGVSASESTLDTSTSSLTTRPTPPPPPTSGELVAPEHRQQSTTCEGAIKCTLLQGACDLVGGTHTEWDSSDHGHAHGICTWPWE